MKTKWTLLVAGTVSAIVLSVSLVHAVVQPLMITNLSGTVRIQQDVPCGDPVDFTARIVDGRMDITAYILRDDVLFDLTRLEMFLTPFSVRRACMGVPVFADFREIGVRLAGAVRFPGHETAEVGSQLYRFTIPKEEFLIYESIVDNVPVQQPETIYQRPSEDVTGLIDLRRRTVQLRVVLAIEMRFRAACAALGARCTNKKFDGTQTADVLGVSASTAPPQ